MSDPDHNSDPNDGITRRAIVTGMAVTSVLVCDAARASAEDAPFAERFVTFDPPIPLAPIALVDRRGHATDLAPRRGRTCLIALWANWCPACHRDVPRLAAAQRSLAKEGIDVALINIDIAPPPAVLAQSSDLSTGMVPLFFDPEGHRLAAPSPDGRRSPLQVFGMPILFVVDRDGLVRGYVKGSVDWTNPSVRGFFHALADA